MKTYWFTVCYNFTIIIIMGIHVLLEIPKPHE